MSDTVDYGPLDCLVGVWKGSDGMDVAPEPDDDEHNPYYETLVFEAAGDVTNAEEQVLSMLRYHQVVTRKSNPAEDPRASSWWHSALGHGA